MLRILSTAFAFNIYLIAAFALSLVIAIRGRNYRLWLYIGIALQFFEYVRLVIAQGLSIVYLPMLICSVLIAALGFGVCGMTREEADKDK